jgi:hypothetical protein
VTQKIKKLDDSAQLVRSGLTVWTFIFFPICATLFSSLLLFQIILMKIQISLKDLEWRTEWYCLSLILSSFFAAAETKWFGHEPAC